MKVKGNTILITGGGSGIGFELAKQLHKFGNKLILVGRSEVKLNAARSQLSGSEVVIADVSKASELEKLVAECTLRFPDLNILVNNAGIMRTINLHESNSGNNDLDEFTREIETNLTAPIRLSKLFIPHLKGKKDAAIINVSSGLAFVPLPVSPIYCATKAGLHSFTLSLRAQLKNTNIKVFELAPPATQTELLGDFEAEDMKGIAIMKVEDMVSAAIRGLQNDQFEIRPGQSNQLKFMSRLAPDFILAQMSKTVDRMLANSKK